MSKPLHHGKADHWYEAADFHVAAFFAAVLLALIAWGLFA